MGSLGFTLAGIGIAVSTSFAHPAVSGLSSIAGCQAHAPEAATRSGVQVDVLIGVMQAESGGNPSAVSTKGAIGCMQVMPSTWADLSARYGLGADAYDARKNMIGGSLYLAELARRFGWPGAYAAYNAGPARYIRYIAGGVPLPAETATYEARMGGTIPFAAFAIQCVRWQEARLFLTRASITRKNSDGLELSPKDDGVNLQKSSASERSVSNAGRVPTLFPLLADASTVQR